jgi:hypothetical protein
MSTPSRGLKVTLGGVASAVGIFIALQPYFTLKEKVERHSEEIRTLKTKIEVDHDLLIKIAGDVGYIKGEVGDLKTAIKGVTRWQGNNGSQTTHGSVRRDWE